MASTLAQLEARVAQLLLDTANAIFTTGLIDEGLRLALHEYSETAPLGKEAVITLPGDGREVALNGVSGLLAVTEAWWPYDSDATDETWPPNRVRGFRTWWDDGAPVLFLDIADGDQPQQDDELRLWYTAIHTVQNLDSAAASTLPTAHESMLVLGAAGYCCLARSADLNETAANMAVSTPNYAALGDMYLKEFRAQVARLRPRRLGGLPYARGWRLDEWDEFN